MGILNLFKNTYNTLDETVFKGTLPLGSAAEIPGNTSTLNGEPVVYDGKKKDWVPREEYIKSNASKVGSQQAQAVREVLTQVVNNPIINTGLQIGSKALELTGGPMFQKTITGQTPMEMIGKASNLAITKPLSDLTNVDPLWVDTALALTPFGKAGLSKLGKLRIPGTRGGAFLPPGRGLKIKGHQRVRDPRNLNFGNPRTRYALANPNKKLETLVGQALDVVTEGVMPQSLKGLKFGPSINKAVNTIAATSVSKPERLNLPRTAEVKAWIDEGNEFIRKRGSQRGWENKIFTDSNGNQWELKSQGTGIPYAPRSRAAAERDKAGRTLRENAWKAQLKEVLEQRGTYTPERYAELSKRITSRINKMKTHIRNVNKGKPREEWISFGHKKSLGNDGINVPENVVFEPYRENVSTQHKSDASDAAVRQSGGPLSVEEWVIQQELLEEFGDNILPYGGLPNDLQLEILNTKSQVARDALIEAYHLKNTKIE